MNIYIQYSDEKVEYHFGDINRLISRVFRENNGFYCFSEEIEEKFLKRFNGINGEEIVVYSKDLFEFISRELSSFGKDNLVKQFYESTRDLI